MRGTVYERGIFSANSAIWSVIIAEIGEGNIAAAQEAERAISHFDPDLLLFVGVAGGVKDLKLGDVIAATCVYSYEVGKDTAKGFLPRTKTLTTAYPVVQRARVEARTGRWRARIMGVSQQRKPTAIAKPIAAGEKVVASNRSATCQFIRAHMSDAAAVEMEGVGMLRSAEANNVPAGVIRGISDLLSKKSASDQAGWQARAAANAAAFTFELLANLTLEQWRSPSQSERAAMGKHPRPEPERLGVISSDEDQGRGLPPLEYGPSKPLRKPSSARAKPSVPLSFTGRDEALRWLSEAFSKERNGVCAIVTGVAGVGKTSLVSKFIELSRRTSVVWIDGADAEAGITEWALSNGIQLSPSPHAAQAAASKRWAQDRSMVVLDGATVAQIANFPIGGPAAGYDTIITTQDRGLRLRLSVDSVGLELEPWSPELGVEYLQRTTRRPSADPLALRRLCEFVGGLPLAMALMARLLDRAGEEAASLLERLRHAPLGLLESVTDAVTPGVAATFRVVFDRLTPDETKVLAGIAACAKRTRPEVVAYVVDYAVDKTKELLGNLERYSIVDYDGDSGWITHDVVRLAASQLSEFGALARRHDEVALRRAILGQASQYWPFVEAELGEILAAVDRGIDAGNARDVGASFVLITPYLRDRGLVDWVRVRCERILAQLSPGSQEAAAMIGHLAICMNMTGRSGEAAVLFEQSLDVYRRLNIKSGIAITLMNWASSLHGLGGRAEAIRKLAKAKKIFAKLGDNHGLGKVAFNMGSFARKRGAIAEAVRHFETAVGLLEDHPSSFLAAAYEGLGEMHLAQGATRKAIAALQKSVELYYQMGVPEPLVHALTILCDLYWKRGQMPQAIEMASRAVAVAVAADAPMDIQVRLRLKRAAALAEGERAGDAMKEVQQVRADLESLGRPNVLMELTIALEEQLSARKPGVNEMKHES